MPLSDEEPCKTKIKITEVRLLTINCVTTQHNTFLSSLIKTIFQFQIIKVIMYLGYPIAISNSGWKCSLDALAVQCLSATHVFIQPNRLYKKFNIVRESSQSLVIHSSLQVLSYRLLKVIDRCHNICFLKAAAAASAASLQYRQSITTTRPLDLLKIEILDY